jgi:hypothetical protein
MHEIKRHGLTKMKSLYENAAAALGLAMMLMAGCVAARKKTLVIYHHGSPTGDRAAQGV